MIKKRLTFIFTTALTAFLFVLFLWKADFEGIICAVGNARADFFVYAILIMLISLAIRAHRWKLLLKSPPSVPMMDFFSAMMAGFAISFLAPGRMGELARPYILAKKNNLSVSSTFATVVLERIIDTIVLLIMLSLFLVLPSGITGGHIPMDWTDKLYKLGIIGFGVIFSILLILLFMKWKTKTFKKIILSVTSFLPGKLSSAVADMAEKFLLGFSSLKADLNLFFICMESIIIWTLIALYNWMAFIAFDTKLSFPAMFLMIPMTAIGIALPTPGGIGGYHAVCRFGLVTFFAVEINTAVAATVAVHALSWITMSTTGLFFLLREGYTLSTLKELSVNVDKDAKK